MLHDLVVGVVGAFIVDLFLAVAAVVLAPRLLRRAMRRRMAGAFGKKPAGADVRIAEYLATAGKVDPRGQ